MTADPALFDPRLGPGVAPLARFPAESRGLLTAGAVAELLGVPVSWVYEQSRRRRIPTVTLGRYRRYRWEAIEAWVAELEREAAESRPR